MNSSRLTILNADGQNKKNIYYGHTVIWNLYENAFYTSQYALLLGRPTIQFHILNTFHKSSVRIV